MRDPILPPVLALALWSLVVLAWLAATRARALRGVRIDLSRNFGGRGQDLERAVPPRVAWPAHNYTHLHEQPTVFYAVALATAMLGAGDGWGARLAWAYALLRIVHSVWQIRVNRVDVRALLFFASTAALIALTVRALLIAVR